MSRFCMFCAIINGPCPADIRYEDDDLIVIADRNPRAPVHRLIIPRQHVESLTSTDPALMGRMLQTAARMATTEGIDQSGYRVFVNSGPDAWQTIPHLHIHLMGGAPLTFDRAMEATR